MTSAETSLTPGEWTLDPAHSSVNFTVRHLGIATVRGRFNHFDASCVVGADGAEITATIYLDSFDTGLEMRDGHVRSAELLDAENRPTLTFRSTRPVRIGPKFQVAGEVTIGEVSKPVTLDAEWGGNAPFPATGQQHAGFVATGRINRLDFGIGSGLPTAVVSDAVAIELDIQLVEPTT